jgi:N-hydroxyarylamine O-acetyltransferase
MNAAVVPVEAYLRRIGATRPDRPDADALRALHVAHLERVPFENLDIHRGVPIELGPASVTKIVDRGRGGFCYELNGAFASLLAALGFEVALMQARAYRADGEVGIPFDHLCLRVELDRPWLADVGFGASFVEPLRLEPGVDQLDPAGTYRIDDCGDGWFDLTADGARQYRFELAGRSLDEFAPGCRFHQSPDSHFARGTVVSRRVVGGGRITLSGNDLIETVDGTRSEVRLTHAEAERALVARFGIVSSGGEWARMPR